MKNNTIYKCLFVIVILNIIPSALLKLFGISDVLYTALYAIVYAIQTVFLLIYYHNNKIKINKKEVIIVVILLLMAISSYSYCLIKWNEYNYNEFLVYCSIITNTIYFIVLMNHLNTDEASLLQFFKKIVYLGIICCFANCLLNFNILLNFANITGSYQANFSSIFPNRNSFGIFMLICIISNKYLIVKKNKNIDTFNQIFLIINLVMTMSRNAILGLTLFYILLLIIRQIGRHGIIMRRTIIISVFLIILASLCFYKIKNNEILLMKIDMMFLRTESLQSGSGRFEVWDNGYKIFKNYNFISGVGRYKALNLNRTIYGNSLQYFHSIYFETLAEYGFIGISLLIYLLIFLKNKITTSRIEKEYLFITKASFYSFLFISIFESTCRFSIGYADTIALVYFIAIPILIGNTNNQNYL